MVLTLTMKICAASNYRSHSAGIFIMMESVRLLGEFIITVRTQLAGMTVPYLVNSAQGIANIEYFARQQKGCTRWAGDRHQ